jgi:hypothetical protein
MDPNANVREQLELARQIFDWLATYQVPGIGDQAIGTHDAQNVARLAELVLALDEWRSKGGFAPAAAPASTDETKWNFWLPDSDRSCGWTNHGYVLQFVCAGNGATPEEAWQSAKRGELANLGVPEEFLMPDSVVAIREDAERPLEVE